MPCLDLNGKHTTKSEVANLLESAGLSRSNPTHIVPQGRVVNLTVMKDAQRLDMLREVAGTNTCASAAVTAAATATVAVEAAAVKSILLYTLPSRWPIPAPNCRRYEARRVEAMNIMRDTERHKQVGLPDASDSLRPTASHSTAHMPQPT